MHCWEIKGKFTSPFFLFLPFIQNKITLPLNLSFTLSPGYSYDTAFDKGQQWIILRKYINVFVEAEWTIKIGGD